MDKPIRAFRTLLENTSHYLSSQSILDDIHWGSFYASLKRHLEPFVKELLAQNAELTAENERLKKVSTPMIQKVHKLQIENDRLRDDLSDVKTIIDTLKETIDTHLAALSPDVPESEGRE